MNLDNANVSAAWEKYNYLLKLIEELYTVRGEDNTLPAITNSDWIKSLFTGVYIHLYNDLDIPEAVNFLIQVPGAIAGYVAGQEVEQRRIGTS